MRKARLAGVLIVLVALTAGAGGAKAQEGARDLLPDLRPRPQDHVTFDALGIYGGQSVNGCMADEIVEDGARRCLRFDQSIANLGEGPFELRYEPPTYLLDPFMYQRILRSDGTWTERQAEEYELHPTHGHFHYKGFGVSRLWRSDASGARLDRQPTRTGRKNGFCVMDIEQIRSNAPDSRYDGSGCTASQDYKNGITQGWADTYGAHLPDQYIEVSDVADGYYELETLADPDGTVLETSENNNSGSILIKLTGNSVTMVRVLSDPTVDRPAAAPPGAPPGDPAPPPPAAPPAAGTGSGSAPAAAPPARPAAKKKKKRKARRTCRRARKRAAPPRRPTARRSAKSGRRTARSCRRKRR